MSRCQKIKFSVALLNSSPLSSISCVQHFGYTSSDSILKMEEPVRHLGFHIEHLGSCKVIRHVLKGTQAFTGTLFTNALSNSHIMERLQGHAHALEEADI